MTETKQQTPFLTARACPFCNARKTEACGINQRTHYLRCMICGAEGPIAGGVLGATMRWNGEFAGTSLNASGKETE